MLTVTAGYGSLIEEFTYRERRKGEQDGGKKVY